MTTVAFVGGANAPYPSHYAPMKKFSPTGLACLLLLVLAMLPACLSRNSSPTEALGRADSTNVVQVWVTHGDESALLEKQPGVPLVEGDTTGTDSLIRVDVAERFQQMDGFGAAVTGSAAYLLHRKMNPDHRRALLEELFTPKGIGLSYLRMTIGASDFSLHDYTYDDVPAGQQDPTLDRFSLGPDTADVMPVLQAIFAVNPQIKLMGSPWSAPAWMKTSGALAGGKLKKEAYGPYADYFVKYTRAFAARNIPVAAVTIQNEPGHTAKYPSMLMTAPEQADFIKNHLGPAFAKNGLTTHIIAFDHNWDSPEYPITVLNDSLARSFVTGSAFHCYAGNVADMSKVHEAHPDKGLYFTECSGGAWAPKFADNLKWNMVNLVIGATRNWAKTVLLWNLALDQNSGPTNGGCTDCRGVVTLHADSSRVIRNVEYYVLGHVARFVRPGAYRVSSTQPPGNVLLNVAFINPDGSRVLLVLNNGAAPSAFRVQEGAGNFRYILPAGSVATFTWEQPAASKQ